MHRYIYVCVYTWLVQRRGEKAEREKDRANEAPRIESRPNLRR